MMPVESRWKLKPLSRLDLAYAKVNPSWEIFQLGPFLIWTPMLPRYDSFRTTAFAFSEALPFTPGNDRPSPQSRGPIHHSALRARSSPLCCACPYAHSGRRIRYKIGSLTPSRTLLSSCSCLILRSWRCTKLIVSQDMFYKQHVRHIPARI
jgi:hypothetical protein